MVSGGSFWLFITFLSDDKKPEMTKKGTILLSRAEPFKGSSGFMGAKQAAYV